MAATKIDIESLYAAHREPLLLFLARRTADPQVALDLWAETFAHAAAGLTRFRGGDDAGANVPGAGVAAERFAAAVDHLRSAQPCPARLHPRSGATPRCCRARSR